jgi:hypothetical protein
MRVSRARTAHPEHLEHRRTNLGPAASHLFSSHDERIDGACNITGRGQTIPFHIAG